DFWTSSLGTVLQVVVGLQPIQLAAGDDGLRYPREVISIVSKRIKFRNVCRRKVSEQRRVGRRVVPGLVRAKPDEFSLSAFPADSRDMRSARVGSRRLKGGEDLGPGHVGVRDPGVAQGDGARQRAADGDWLGINRVGGAHEFIGAVHRVAVNPNKQYVWLRRV